jgi:hypothetical protein
VAFHRFSTAGSRRESGRGLPQSKTLARGSTGPELIKITAMPPSIQIRAYQPTDLEHLYQICLQTMDYGRDATPLYADGRLPGLFYAAPYVTCDPSLCLVACLDQKPCGYILGTNDSRAFEAWCEANWFSTLRTRYPVPPMEDSSADAKLIRLIHRAIAWKRTLRLTRAICTLTCCPVSKDRESGQN